MPKSLHYFFLPNLRFFEFNNLQNIFLWPIELIFLSLYLQLLGFHLFTYLLVIVQLDLYKFLKKPFYLFFLAFFCNFHLIFQVLL